ncbi:aromatic acid exporter family protein [Planococcus halotolerans]|uniref:Aromatic acid exporter family protein n=1 Tax=Planococcus halotolerans TaxID=2233542 RepID=A0A365KX19_9BACL|nr:aromatic acid exporter family protein [Planococcus halotolerans]QHJ72254.1 aromatic acid exporter family protein [Planococcus halotolerans]RAZ77726.1 aromatic acid exporter family protein [Planococcus halotolerans]
MRSFHFNGSRILKTGIAIFLTATICLWFGWPPVFAVITAIVTIEPTVRDSITKGLVRFPASAIGSAFAVLFITLFGDAPITYTLAAVATILVCYRLKLHAGLLVATLTAVAMIEVIHDHFLVSFFIRLGTTTIGLVVSTAVNMLVFPPNYRDDILKSIQNISERAGTMLEHTFHTILFDSDADLKEDKDLVNRLTTEIRKTEKLIHYHRDDFSLYPRVRDRETELRMAERQLLFLHNLEFHLDALLRIPYHSIKWSQAERNIIMQAVAELADDLQNSNAYDHETHQQQLKIITDFFWEDSKGISTSDALHPTLFAPEFKILYELITIYDLVDKFFDPNSVKAAREAEK